MITNTPKHKHLIFTSAGDNTNIRQWLETNPNFDVWVCYYGNETFPLKDQVAHYTERKGGKFQNFHFFFHQHKDVFEQYESIMIMDDDIILSTPDINQLFGLHTQLQLQLIQPAFDRTGKVSHAITERKPFTHLRYTNFIEVTCPIFKLSAIRDFMDQYDPTVNATGVDWWYCTEIDNKEPLSIAICDSIWCLNPHDEDKSNDGVREIDRLLSNQQRIDTWKEVKSKNNLHHVKENHFVTYKKVYNFNMYQIFSWLLSYPQNIILRAIRKVKRLKRTLLQN